MTWLKNNLKSLLGFVLAIFASIAAFLFLRKREKKEDKQIDEQTAKVNEGKGRVDQAEKLVTVAETLSKEQESVVSKQEEKVKEAEKEVLNVTNKDVHGVSSADYLNSKYGSGNTDK